MQILYKQIGDEVMEYSAEDYAQLETDKAAALAIQATEQAEAEARATEKAALLERLGITEAEAKLLLS